MQFQRRLFLCLLSLLFLGGARESFAADDAAALRKLVAGSKRMLLLGDSITAAGNYATDLDAWIVAQRRKESPRVINMGLPSETVSGLSEDGHAGGAFPRPDLFERLDRVLKTAQPDLVFACYGMNCGIYQPLDEKRFERYQQGITKLKQKVEAAGAKLVIITPPFYDALKQPKMDFYNGVLDRYSEWLIAQRSLGWLVIDLHGPMTREVAKRRQQDPKFTFAGDGVHPNEAGHWFIASTIIAALGDENAAAAQSPRAMLEASKVPVEIYPLVQARMSVLRDSYVGTAGHLRPGVAKGKPIDEANQEADKLTAQIQKLMDAK